MAIGTIQDWNDIWHAIEDARKYAKDAQSFLERLERHKLTILPLAVRRNADLFGVGMVAKVDLGYATIDPTLYVVSAAPEELR